MDLPVGYEFKGSKYDDWTVTDAPIRGDACNLYPARSATADLDVLVKIPRAQGNVDLVEHEQNALGILRAETDVAPDDVPTMEQIERMKFRWFVPNLVDVAYLYDGTDIWTCNIIERLDGFHTLAEVKAAYPNGVHPKDAAWMWRRLLMAIGFAHHQGLIHGAPFPENVMIHPEKHGLTLIDWCYSVPTDNGPITAMVGKYRNWYPHEVEKKLTPEPCTDIHIAAHTWLWLMGDQVEPKLRGFAKLCMFDSRSKRPHDAWATRQHFDALIERMWGPRKFREFKLP